MAVEIVLLDAYQQSGSVLRIPAWPEARPGDLRIFQYITVGGFSQVPYPSFDGWEARETTRWLPQNINFYGGVYSRLVLGDGDPAREFDTSEVSYAPFAVVGEIRIRGASAPTDADWHTFTDQEGDSRTTNPSGGFDPDRPGRHLFGLSAHFGDADGEITTPSGYTGDVRTRQGALLDGVTGAVYASEILDPGPYTGPTVATPDIGEGFGWSLFVESAPIQPGPTATTRLTPRSARGIGVATGTRSDGTTPAVAMRDSRPVAAVQSDLATTLSVTPFRPPLTLPDVEINRDDGDVLSEALPAAEGGEPPYTYSLTPTPTDLAFDPATRVLSGTVVTESAGTYAYAVTDALDSEASSTLTLNVVPATSAMAGGSAQMRMTTARDSRAERMVASAIPSAATAATRHAPVAQRLSGTARATTPIPPTTRSVRASVSGTATAVLLPPRAVDVVYLDARSPGFAENIDIPEWPEAQPGDVRIFSYVVTSPLHASPPIPEWAGWTARGFRRFSSPTQLFSMGVWSRVVDTHGDPLRRFHLDGFPIFLRTTLTTGEMRLRSTGPVRPDDWHVFEQDGTERPTNPPGDFHPVRPGRHVGGVIGRRLDDDSQILIPFRYRRDISGSNLGQLAVFASPFVDAPTYFGPTMFTTELAQGLTWSLFVVDKAPDLLVEEVDIRGVDGSEVDQILPEATGGTPPYQYSVGVFGLSFDPATRRLTGRLTRTANGVHEYRVRDADGTRAEGILRIVVVEPLQGGVGTRSRRVLPAGYADLDATLRLLCADALGPRIEIVAQNAVYDPERSPDEWATLHMLPADQMSAGKTLVLEESDEHTGIVQISIRTPLAGTGTVGPVRIADAIRRRLPHGLETALDEYGSYLHIEQTMRRAPFVERAHWRQDVDVHWRAWLTRQSMAEAVEE